MKGGGSDAVLDIARFHDVVLDWSTDHGCNREGQEEGVMI